MNPDCQDLPRWYCLRTQVKREHIAAEALRAMEGIEVFCPRLTYRKPTRRGRIWWTEALFPGYVLARFPLGPRQRQVTHCQGVRGILRFGNEVPCIADAVVERLQEEIRQHQHDNRETIRAMPVIRIGDEVAIALGPLQGMNGRVLSFAPGKERVRVLLEFLGRPHPIDVDLFSLLLPKMPAIG